MGTFISHRSPKITGSGGASWKDVRNAISSGESDERLISTVLNAFQAQYASNPENVLVDDGVKCVARVFADVIKQKSELNQKTLGQFILSARKELASSQCNTLFSDFAISAATTAFLTQSDNPSKTFASEYATKVLDYSISRDLPMMIGSFGLVNLESTDKLLETVKGNFRLRVARTESKDIIELINRALSLPKGDKQ